MQQVKEGQTSWRGLDQGWDDDMVQKRYTPWGDSRSIASITESITETTIWLCTHEPLLMDIVASLKALTEAEHRVHLGKVKAHAG